MLKETIYIFTIQQIKLKLFDNRIKYNNVNLLDAFNYNMCALCMYVLIIFSRFITSMA